MVGALRRTGPRLRRTRDRVTAYIDRPTATVIAADDPAALATDDFEALMTALRRRFDLGPLPNH